MLGSDHRRIIAATAAMALVLMTEAAMAQSTTTPATGGAASTAPRGPLTPQAGSLVPNAGMIRALNDTSVVIGDQTKTDASVANPKAFWGKLTPYAGMIRAHEGMVTEMAGMIRAHEGDLTGMAGMIRAHWGEIGATAGMIRAHDSSGAEGYSAALADYRTFVNQSASFWAAPVESATGKSFAAAFADPMLAKYGINLSDPASLSKLSPDRREMFFLDWHDGLMQYSGADQVDHWMKAIGWTPALTQQQGSGSRAVIGLVDFFVAKDPDIAAKVIYSGGYTAFTGHGAGVGSLILASHDGKGVMGIAPNARVAAYNPFDGTGTASWADVNTGIQQVTKAGASVVNLSLGVPGWTFHSEWRNVFKTSAIDSMKDKVLYVIAAGNSGTVQTQNVDMNGAEDSTYLVVGSVGPDGLISSFSNQPGLTCLTDGETCKNTQRAGVGNTGDRFLKSDYLKESGYLMNRFLVAPGELILVADGVGGVTRMSGTSFAAPLVAGAVALIHDRWPWLKNYPRDVAKILLDTATDLGAPGADPVYGRGMLNIDRAQSALDFDKLRYELWNGTKKTDLKVTTLRTNGLQAAWGASDMYFAAFEKIDSAERDFLIPLSSRLFGTMRNGQYFQEFVYNHFVNWLATGVGFAGRRSAALGFSDVLETDVIARPDSWSFSMSGRMVREHFANGGMGRMGLRSAMTMRSPSNGFSISFGTGDGALSLSGRSGLNTTDDFDPNNGGVNPLLGFATGGAHMGSKVALGSKVAVSVGMTQQSRSLQQALGEITTLQDRILLGRQGRYSASAQNVRVDYQPMEWLGLSASFTHLEEDRAFLGVRSIADSDFGDGTSTDGVTLQADAEVVDDLVVFGSATLGRSTSGGNDSAFRLGSGGAVGTAFQFGVAKSKLFGRQDRMRLAISQPLTMERGTLDFTSVMVIDRETGAKGLVTQKFNLAGSQPRRALVEASYGTALMDGQAELSVFGRGELSRVDTQTPRLMAGGRATIAF